MVIAKEIKAGDYVPGMPVFLSVLVSGNQAGGCKARYTVDVFRQGAAMREIKGLNYDLGSPGNDTFEVLSSSQALPSGALAHVAVFLQRMNNDKYSLTLKAQQGGKVILNESTSGSFTAGEVAVCEYDIYFV